MTTQYPEEWRDLIAEIRRVYNGPITYAAHGEREFDRIPLWDALDFISVTAYFPLGAPKRASVEELITA